MLIDKLFYKLDLSTKIVKKLNDGFDDYNLLDASNIYTFIKYKYNISNIKDYTVVNDVLYILNIINTIENKKYINYSLHVINLKNFIITNVLEFGYCSDAIIYKNNLYISDSGVIFKYKLETFEYRGFCHFISEKLDNFCNIVIINDILYLCYHKTNEIFVVYNTNNNKYNELNIDINKETLILNNDEEIYIFNYPNLTIFNVVNKKINKSVFIKYITKITKNIYKLENEMINISNNKIYTKDCDLMVNEFKIKDNLYLYNENIFLYTSIKLNYKDDISKQSQILIDDIIVDELYKRTGLFKNLETTFGKNLSPDNITKIFHDSKYYNTYIYYIYYIKYNKLHKKYIIDIYNIAKYLQDIDVEHIKNCIVY